MPTLNAQRGFAAPLILIAVVLILAGGAFFYFQKGSKLPNLTTKTEKQESTDFSFELSDKKLMLTGSFADPSVIKLGDNYILYVNSFGANGSSNLIYTSKDGVSWQDTGKKVPGGPTARALLTDNGVRYYYPTQTPINPSDPPSQMLSAFSTDGINFTNEEGVRMKPSAGYTLEGPSIVKLENGTYRMYFSEFKAESVQERKSARILGATSKDGLTWTRDDKPSIESDSVVEKAPSNWPQALRPFVLKRPAGGYIMFYNTHSKIYLAYSKDGITWKKLGGLGIKGADVDAFYLTDGTIRIYYGDFSEATSGVVYTGILKETKEKPKEETNTPQENVQPLGNKPAPPPDCVGKEATDPNLSESCQLWFKIQ